jgi:hypothetical protein
MTSLRQLESASTPVADGFFTARAVGCDDARVLARLEV